MNYKLLSVAGIAALMLSAAWTQHLKQQRMEVDAKMVSVHLEAKQQAFDAETQRLREKLTQSNTKIVTLNQQIDKLTRKLDTYELGYEMDEFVVTAYSPYDDPTGINSDGTPNTTATGTKPHIGTFAVDPKVIPYGSTVIIMYTDGTMERGIAEDTGGAIKGNRIDVYRSDYSTAMTLGRREATVMWYENNS